MVTFSVIGEMMHLSAIECILLFLSGSDYFNVFLFRTVDLDMVLKKKRSFIVPLHRPDLFTSGMVSFYF